MIFAESLAETAVDRSARVGFVSRQMWFLLCSVRAMCSALLSLLWSLIVYRGGHFRNNVTGAMMPAELPWCGRDSNCSVQSLHYDWRSMRQRHRAGVFIMLDYITPTVVIQNPAVAAEYYRDHLEHVREPSACTLGHLLAALLSNAIGTSHGACWGRHTATLHKCFGVDGAKRRKLVVQSTVRDFIKGLPAVVGSFFFEPQDAIWSARLDRCAQRVMACVLYGDDMPEPMFSQLADLANQHERVAGYVGVWYTRVPFAGWMPTRCNTLVKKLLVDWEDYNNRHIECILRGEYGASSVLGELLKSKTTQMSRKELLQNLYEFLLLNVDVFYVSLASLLYRLAAHREHQDALRAEVAAHYEAWMCNGAEMPLLDAFLLEVARHHNGLSLTIPEKLPTGRCIGGYWVPRGTIVGVDVHAVNHDASVFADADCFDPDRFVRDPSLRYKMHRFGLGPRRCTGMWYADAILRIFACEVMKGYTVEFADGSCHLPTIGKRSFGLVYITPDFLYPEVRLAPVNHV